MVVCFVWYLCWILVDLLWLMPFTCWLRCWFCWLTWYDLVCYFGFCLFTYLFEWVVVWFGYYDRFWLFVLSFSFVLMFYYVAELVLLGWGLFNGVVFVGMLVEFCGWCVVNCGWCECLFCYALCGWLLIAICLCWCLAFFGLGCWFVCFVFCFNVLISVVGGWFCLFFGCWVVYWFVGDLLFTWLDGLIDCFGCLVWLFIFGWFFAGFGT